MPRPIESMILRAVICAVLALAGIGFCVVAYTMKINFPLAEFVGLLCIEAMGACFGGMLGIAFGRARLFVAVGLCAAFPAMIAVDAVVAMWMFYNGVR